MAVDSKDNSFSILYLSPHVHKRLHTITLLILDNERDPQKHHYVYVKHLSRLIAHRSKNTKRSHVCLSCLQVFHVDVVMLLWVALVVHDQQRDGAAAYERAG